MKLALKETVTDEMLNNLLSQLEAKAHSDKTAAAVSTHMILKSNREFPSSILLFFFLVLASFFAFSSMSFPFFPFYSRDMYCC